MHELNTLRAPYIRRKTLNPAKVQPKTPENTNELADATPPEKDIDHETCRMENLSLAERPKSQNTNKQSGDRGNCANRPTYIHEPLTKMVDVWIFCLIFHSYLSGKGWKRSK